jgi:CheY-like chemotaxis protein
MTHVLVVDDDDDIRDAVCWALAEEGYAVVEAPDGVPAVEHLREHPEGMVVLLDMNMPSMDGLAVLRTVEEHPTLAARHAYILMSAQHVTLPQPLAERVSCLQIQVLSKPFDLDALLTTVGAAAQRLSGAAVS